MKVVRPLGRLALAIGLVLYLCSAYYRLQYGVTQRYSYFLVLSLFVVLVGASLMVVAEVKPETEPARRKHGRVALVLMAIGFFTLAVLWSTLLGSMSESIAVPLLLGLFACTTSIVLVLLLKKFISLKGDSLNGTKRLSRTYYYLAILGLTIALLIVLVQLFR